MSVEKVKLYLSKWERDKDVVELTVSTATVELAAEALKVPPGRIAKSVTLKNGDSAMLIVTAGDSRIDNKKFKKQFGFSPRMLSHEEALSFTGYAVGGICPFGLPPALQVYLDISLKQYETVFPACGSASSMIELSNAELEEYSQALAWVDVARLKNEIA